MVLARRLSLDEAYKIIDWNTLIFLLGMMILVAHFQISGFFDWVAMHVARVARTRFQLLALAGFHFGILAAFFVNDTICLVFTPIVLVVTDRLKIPPVPYLIAVATSSNVGSVMSVTGNPQNALVGISAHFSFLGFLAHLAPVALIGLAINVAVLAIFFRQRHPAPSVSHEPSPSAGHARSHAADKVLRWRALLVIVLWIFGYSFPLVAISVGAFILVIGRVKAQNIYQRLDWELLLFFASLFVVIHGFQASGAVDYLIARFHHALEGSFASATVRA